MPKDEKQQDKKLSPALTVVPQEAPASQSAVAPPALKAGNVLAGGGAGEKQTREAYGGIDGILEKTGKDAKGAEARQGDGKALQAYGAQRKAVVDRGLAAMGSQQPTQILAQSGSDAITSDVDVTIESRKGPDAVSTFNDSFAQHFGDSKDTPAVGPDSSSPDVTDRKP